MKRKDNYVKGIIIIPLVLLLTLVFAYVVTHGTMKLFTKEVMGINYVGMWESLKVGRFDLDKEFAGGELFIRDGKIYTYYGPFPALLRGLIEIFFKRGNTDWSRISVILAGVLTVISSALAYFKVASNIPSSKSSLYYYTVLFSLSVAFGSPVIFLLSSAYIYHEAILWGLAWSSVFIFAFVSLLYSREISLLTLFVLSLSGGFALLSRASFGVGPVIATCILVFVILFSNKTLPSFSGSSIPIWKVLIMLVIPLLICVCFQMKVNYERFGNPFQVIDYKYYLNTKLDPSRLKGFEKYGGLFNYKRIPHAFVNYFIPNKTFFSDTFPYVVTRQYDNPLKLPEAYFDLIEPSSPVPINTLYLVFTGIIGLFALATNFRFLGFALFLPFLISCISYLSVMVLSLRYIAEFTPLLMICSIASFSSLIKLEKKSLLLTRSVLFLVFLCGIYGATATMLQQKLFLWSVPFQSKEKITDALNTTGNAVRTLLNSFSQYKLFEAPRVITSEGFPLNPFPGQLWSQDNDETIFWFDGLNWMPIKDENKKYIGPITMMIKFEPHPNSSEPIVVTGVMGSGDIIYVKYLSDKKAQIGFDHWGTPGLISKPIELDPLHYYFLEVSLGSFYPNFKLGNLNSKVIVKLDGKTVLNDLYGFHPITSLQIKIGKNEIGATSCSKDFSGKIEEPRRFGIKHIN